MAHNHNRTDAVSVWKCEATAEQGDCGGNRNDNRGNIRVAYCKKCGERTKVKVRSTDKTNADGYPLIKAKCLNEGCGNAWYYADRSVVLLKDNIRMNDISGKSKQILKIAERHGAIGDLGIDRHLETTHNRMITTDRHPHYDDVKTYTIKCRKCGVERHTSCFIRDFRCPDCNGHHYSYIMLNGEYL